MRPCWRTLDTGAVWSVARGLARRESEYKSHLAECDREPRDDLDGRGPLSEEALAAFSSFFLEVCIDQVSSMESMVEPARLRERVLGWAQEEPRTTTLPEKAGSILEAVLYRGRLGRGEVGALLGTTDRHARRLVSSLVDPGVLASESPRAPLGLAFPTALAARWMPGLFPEQGR